jgi:translation elongation factor EF-G
MKVAELHGFEGLTRTVIAEASAGEIVALYGLEGVEIGAKLVLVYSPHGLNDTAHTEGCCCCGGNEIANSMEVNVNVLIYAILH